MEVGLMMATFVMSALSALCSVAALTILLVTAPKEEGVTESPLPPDGDSPPLGKGGKDSKNSGEWSEATFSRGGQQSYDTHPLKATPDDVEKRRREAVKAQENSNFMNYDGKPQQKIDPALILGE